MQNLFHEFFICFFIFFLPDTEVIMTLL